MPEAFLEGQSRSRPAGLRDLGLLVTRPRALFARVEDTGAYGWALAVLLVLVTLVGYAEAQTGLYERLVDQDVERAQADLEATQGHLLDRVELRDKMEELRKGGEFNKVLRRLEVIVLSPIGLLVSFLLTASVLYAAVALIGRKPEYHTLMAICTYSGFVILGSQALRLVMMLCYKTTRVDTSLQMLAPAGKYAWLAAFDPFRLWYWLLVGLGVVVTQQLGRRSAIVTVSLLLLVASGVRIGLAYMGS